MHPKPACTLRQLPEHAHQEQEERERTGDGGPLDRMGRQEAQE